MAQDPKASASAVKDYSIPEKAVINIVSFAQATLSKQAKFSEYRDKMEAIDIAYARHKTAADLEEEANGVDPYAGVPCGNVFKKDNVTPPIVVSQVDSHVAYLADVFLSGTPLFPVVSRPDKRQVAEQLETLMDDHSILGGHPRQLLKMIKDAVKYNLSAIEVSWEPLDKYQINPSFSQIGGTGSKVESSTIFYNSLKSIDMYNLVWDFSVNPGDVAKDGDYAGYVELMTKTSLKRLMLKHESQDISVSSNHNDIHNRALNSYTQWSNNSQIHYNEPPCISDFISSNRKQRGMDWGAYLGIQADKSSSNSKGLYDGSVFEVFTLYARIMPSEFKIKAPKPNTPQIWKFVIVNNSVLIAATKVTTAYDYLPILLGQPLEDGLSYQTKSTGESAIPFQEAAETLYNIRFAASRRSVSDRALYDPAAIKPKDVNSSAAAPKIPVVRSALDKRPLGDMYQQIPFDMRGTESTIGDAAIMEQFSEKLSGLNGPQQGQFQQGNKSVKEWTDTIAGSNNRLRLPAMTLEHQVFVPLKHILALNIFQFATDQSIVSQRSGNVVDVEIDVIRKEVLSFKLSDGYTPKAKLASTDMLNAGMNMIMNSPILQQAYGQNLPGMFAHLMQLGGVDGFDLYAPEQSQQAPAQALDDNTIVESDVNPETGEPNGQPI